MTLCVRVPAQAAEAELAHTRTRNRDHEVDLVANTVHDSDVRWLGEQLGDSLVDSIVVNTGPADYRRVEGIGIVPLGVCGGGSASDPNSARR